MIEVQGRESYRCEVGVANPLWISPVMWGRICVILVLAELVFLNR